MVLKVYAPEIMGTAAGLRLQAEFELDGNTSMLWYEVDHAYKKYLTYKRAGAFVVSLLWYALENGHDIQVEAPMSEKLYYTLNKYLSPLIAQIYGYKTIKVMCDKLTSKQISNAGAVGTGLSCGIDSFSTIREHIESEPKNYNITHFTFFNVGSHGRGEEGLSLYRKREKISQAYVDDLGKALITINSNLSAVLGKNFIKSHTLRSMSVVLAFQKLFKIYYYASAYHLRDFNLIRKSVNYWDAYAVTCYQLKPPT